PVMIALPLCLAWTSVKSETTRKVELAPVAVAFAVVGVLSIPAFRRPELGPIDESGRLIQTLCDKKADEHHTLNIVLADDGPAYNINTFIVAKQLMPDSACRAELGTVVYDEMNKVPVQASYERLNNADFVLFLKPGVKPGADWSRVHDNEFRLYCERVGK